MGVLGLTPFLQKHCPHVIKAIPERLRDFSGKTIVFDGTLITHRFHFALIPHEYRHVLGWYRLITELRNNDVNAICVFDGVGRSAAKVLENEKRQSARRLILARWSMEVKRQERLRSLHSLLRQSMSIPLEKRMDSIVKLKDIIGQRRKKKPREVSEGLEVENGMEGQPVSLVSFPEMYEEEYAQVEDSGLESSSAFMSSESEAVTSIDEAVIQDQDFVCPDERLPSLIRHDISEQLAALYASHEASSRTIEAITPPIGGSDGLQEEVLESKKQLALSQDEDRVWSKVQRLIAEPRYLRTPPLLKILMQRSKVLSENYERRAKPPTQEMYNQCKMILEALGVPCIEAHGTYEAEGLAAALVRRGLAHYVASEDTDVLVYGAPLLRNVSSRSGAIYAISSEEVRRALRLSRAAFMDFALLIGTDFVPRLRNVGPVRALHFITTHSRIERVVKHESRYVPSDVRSYLAQVRLARRIFTTLPPVPPKEKLKSREVDKERVTEVLSRFGLARAAEDIDWDPQIALAGNFFADNPIGEGTTIGLTETWFN